MIGICFECGEGVVRFADKKPAKDKQGIQGQFTCLAIDSGGNDKRVHNKVNKHVCIQRLSVGKSGEVHKQRGDTIIAGDDYFSRVGYMHECRYNQQARKCV